MEYVHLGQSGLLISRIGLGTMTYGTPDWREWVLSEEQAMPFLRKAIELGITFLDTADMYSLGRSEEIVGKAVREYATRDEMVIATKTFFPVGENPYRRGLSRKRILSAVDDSLRRLKTDYIDLYQIHRFDTKTPPEETIRALEDIVRAGKVRYIGASSMYAWRFAQVQYLARELGTTRFISMQNHYNLIYREEEREMIPQCDAMGVGIIPWSPLARGRLTRPPVTAGSKAGKDTTRGETDTLIETFYDHPSDEVIIQRVESVAERRNVSQAQVALAWLLSKPAVCAPLIGATKLAYLEDAVAALDLQLTTEEIFDLEEPYQPHGVVAIETEAPKPVRQKPG
jgi:1-deoxyxylulose-5-phosphate synthase